MSLAKQTLLEEIQRIQAQKALLIQETDKVKSQLLLQRQALTKVNIERASLSIELEKQGTLLYNLKQQVNIERKSTKTTLDWLSDTLYHLEQRRLVVTKEIEEMESIEIIDRGSINQKVKELARVESEVRDYKQQITIFSKARQEFEEYKMRELQKIDDKRSLVNKKKKDVNNYANLLHNQVKNGKN